MIKNHEKKKKTHSKKFIEKRRCFIFILSYRKAKYMKKRMKNHEKRKKKENSHFNIILKCYHFFFNSNGIKNEVDKEKSKIRVFFICYMQSMI